MDHITKGSCFMADEGKRYLVRCHICERENWAPAVASGICAWCQYDDNLQPPEGLAIMDAHDKNHPPRHSSSQEELQKIGRAHV